MHKTRVKWTLRALEQHRGISGTELIKLVGIEDSGALKLILKDLERNNYIFTDENQKLFEEYYSGFDISDEIYVTETGINFFQDFDDNIKILLDTLSEEQTRTSLLRLLPYLTPREYEGIINSAVHDGYISAKNNDQICISTKDGVVFSRSVFVTSKGRDFMKNRKTNVDPSSYNVKINNYGQMASDIGNKTTSSTNIQINNDAFNNLDELLDFFENDITQRDFKIVNEAFEEIINDPRKKESIIKRIESTLSKYPKLLATAKYSIPLIISNWNKITSLFNR